MLVIVLFAATFVCGVAAVFAFVLVSFVTDATVFAAAATVAVVTATVCVVVGTDSVAIVYG